MLNILSATTFMYFATTMVQGAAFSQEVEKSPPTILSGPTETSEAVVGTPSLLGMQEASATQNAAPVQPQLGATPASGSVTSDAGHSKLSPQAVKTDVARDQLSITVIKNAGKVSLNIAERQEVESKVIVFYREVQKDCWSKLIELKTESSSSTKKQAYFNAIGAFVALIGGVIAYAPAKTVLMGIGISSAGGSNSVIGELSNREGTNKTLSQQNIDDLTAQYSRSITEYKSIVKDEDSTGAKRLDALIDAQSGCMGLLTAMKARGS